MSLRFGFGSLLSGSAGKLLLDQPLQPLRPIPWTLAEEEDVACKRHKDGSSKAANTATGQLKRLQDEEKQLTLEAQQAQAEMNAIRNQLNQPVDEATKQQLVARYRELEAKVQQDQQRVAQLQQEASVLGPQVAQEKAVKEAEKAEKAAQEQRDYSSWSQQPGNEGKTIQEYRQSLKDDKDTAKRQKQDEQATKKAEAAAAAEMRALEQRAKKEAQEAEAAQETLRRAQWQAANPNGGDKEYTAFKRKSTLEKAKQDKLEADYAMWALQPGNAGRSIEQFQQEQELERVQATQAKRDAAKEAKRVEEERARQEQFEAGYAAWQQQSGNAGKSMEDYQQDLELQKAQAAQAKKDAVKEAKRQEEIEGWNRVLASRGLQQTQGYDADMQRKTAWKRRNPGSSDDDFLEYFVAYTAARGAWLQQNPGSDYDAHLEEQEVAAKKRAAWEAKNPGKSYDEHLEEVAQKTEKAKADWKGKFGDGAADDASYAAWKSERDAWAEEAKAESKKGDEARDIHMIDRGNRREAYETVLSEYAKTGNNFDNWAHDRENNSKWRARVVQEEISKLQKLEAKLVPTLAERARGRVEDLREELFVSKFGGSGPGDYARYLEWAENIEKQRAARKAEVAAQGVTLEQTPKTYAVQVDLYFEQLYAALDAFTRDRLDPSWDDWAGEDGAYEEWKGAFTWWKGSFKGLNGVVKRADFETKIADTPEKRRDYEQALAYLQLLKEKYDENAAIANEQEDAAKRAIALAKKQESEAQKLLDQQEKERKAEETRKANAALKEAAKAERAAQGAAKKAAAAAKKAAADALKQAKQDERNNAREERKQRKLEDLKDEISGQPLQLAAQLLVLDEERERLQKLFDEEVFSEDHPLHESNDPPQPKEKRGLRQVTLESGPQQGFEVVPAHWPVAQMALSIEQHSRLFVTADEVFLEPEEVAAVDDGSSVAPSEGPGSMDVGAQIEQALAALQLDRAGPEVEHLLGVLDVGAPVPADEKKRSGVDMLDSATVFLADPLLFNRQYAKRLLDAHVESLKGMHARSMYFNPKVKYSNVAEAVNPDTNSTVEQLLDFFESMARYRNTMLTAKKFMIRQEMKLALAGSGSFTALDASLKAIEALAVRPQWAVEALRMLESDNGRLPGQLYQKQPYFLPLRVFAPPRVGKSATALLTASLAKRLGMCTLYSVSPNKNTPISELSKKLARIGWGDTKEAKEADRLRANAINEPVANVQQEQQCLQMRYNSYSIENIPPGPDAPGQSGSSKCHPDYRKIDMVMYSSDVADDAMRVGSLLADFKYKPVVVFHVRDEAQSLAKELKNEVMPCQSVDVPPPPLLQYLRAYYGNLYGLNCNVTATHFPTLLEQDLYGFMGSIEQNIRVGLPMTASSYKIGTYLGSNFLPKLVPALQPLRPSGYIGVTSMVTWKNSKGEDVTLQVGANHSGIDSDTGQLRGAAQAGAGSTKVEVSQDDIDKLRDLKAEKLELESKKGKNKKARAAIRAKLAKIDEEIEQLEEREGGLDALSVLASNTAKAPSSAADPDYSSGDDSEDEEEAKARKAELKEAKRKETAAQRAKREEEERLNKMRAAEDAESIKQHFLDFMDAKSLPVAAQNGSTYTMVPTYIGALNANISDRGMSSVLRMLGKTAHARAKSKKLGEKKTGVEEGGVAFVLYTSTMNKREDVSKDKIKIVGDKSSPKAEEMQVEEDEGEEDIDALNVGELRDRLRQREVPFRSKTPKSELVELLRDAIEAEQDLTTKSAKELKEIARELGLPTSGGKDSLKARIEEHRSKKAGGDDEEAEEEDLPELDKLSGAAGGSYSPCEGAASDASKKMSALVCVYDPVANKDVQETEEPFYHAFFVSNADVAISNAYFGKEGVRPRGVSKIAVLGYNMLAAGLTVQSVLNTGPEGVFNFCPAFVALATAENAPLDTQLQIAGRSFVELKETDAPPEWKIQLLGVKGMVDRLNRYSEMEEVLANIKDTKMYEALKESFTADLMSENSMGTLGVIGTRRSDFGSVLGLTPEEAKKKAEKAAKLRATNADKREIREAAKAAAKAEKAAEKAAAKAAKAAAKLEREGGAASADGGDAMEE